MPPACSPSQSSPRGKGCALGYDCLTHLVRRYKHFIYQVKGGKDDNIYHNSFGMYFHLQHGHLLERLDESSQPSSQEEKGQEVHPPPSKNHIIDEDDGAVQVGTKSI